MPRGRREASRAFSHPLHRPGRPAYTGPGVLQYTLLSGTAPRTPPGVPRDDVDVQVHHRLPGGGVDVVAVGVEAFVEEVFCVPEEGEECDLFRGRAEDEEEA